MWKLLLSFKVVSVALPLLGVVAVVMGELVSPTIAYILVGVAVAWFVCAIIYWWKNKKRTQPRVAIGGFVIEANTVNITNIIIEVKPEDIHGGGLTGKGERTEIVDSSANAEREYKQNKE